MSVANNSQDNLQETANKNGTIVEDQKNLSMNNKHATPDKSSPTSPSSPLVKPCNRKNAVIIENRKAPQAKGISEKNISKSEKLNQKCCTVSWLHIFKKFNGCKQNVQIEHVSVSLLP